MKINLLRSFLLALCFLLTAQLCLGQSFPLELNTALKNQMTVTESPVGTFDIVTSGIDPWIQTKPVAVYDQKTVYVLSFDFIAENGLDDLEIFYGTPVSAARKVSLGSLPKTTVFTNYKVFMKLVAPVWDNYYDRYRFDFGKKAGQHLQVRNVQIRAASTSEVIELPLNITDKNQVNITANADGSYSIGTLGTDPWVSADINTTFDPEKMFVISFDYTSTTGLDALEIFYGTPFTAARKAALGSLPASTAYKNFKTLMRASAPVWDASYNKLRVDFGKVAGLNINVKNVVLREANEEEYAAFEIKDSVDIELDVTKTSPFLTATQLADGSYQLNTTANDPWIQSKTLTSLYDISKTYILEFEYKADEAYNDLQVFYGPPISGTLSTSFGAIPAATEWTKFIMNPRLTSDNFQDARRSLFRFDFGKNEDATKTILVRNIKIRMPTAAELLAERNSDKFLSKKINTDLLNYLGTNFSDSVSLVKVDTTNLTITGTLSGTAAEYFLAEIEPHQYAFELSDFTTIIPITASNGNFSVTVDRFFPKADRNYDRLYSRWAIVRKNADHNYSLLSNATWATDIASIAQNNLPEKKASSKKGLDGLGPVTIPYFSDLTDLKVKSMKINLLLNGVLSLNPTSLVHDFNGKQYYINPNFVSNFDSSIKLCTNNDILVSLVVLIPINITNETLKRIFVHPDASLGLYSMANVATEEGVEYYAAMIDFLAKRYSRADSLYGRVDHWIIHNEVDAHESWTHAGAKPAPLYTEIYQRSLRTVYYTIRKYSPGAKVFTSFTKHFNSMVASGQFLSKEILQTLNTLNKKEGDFEWGVAWHSYPTNLFNPKVWNDDPAQTPFDFNAPQITPKNIEVIDAYMRQKSYLYNGKKVRTIILSENGFSSNTEKNANANETTQAAALAYFWKKTNNRVPAIEGIQLHRWVDNPGEAGLLFGLWTNKDGTVAEPGTKKEGWNVWNAAGTATEDAVFEPYKSVIGISDWASINQTMLTEVTPYQVTMTIENCSSNLDQVWIAFNGERKQPQADGKVIFYNVASNVSQPYEIRKGNQVLRTDVLNVTSDMNLVISVAPQYILKAVGTSPTNIQLTWKNANEGNGYVIEAKTANGDYQEIARTAATDSAYSHDGLTSGTEYSYRIALLLNDNLSCYSKEVTVKVPFILVQHRDLDKGRISNSEILPGFTLVNTASFSVPYKSITVRYWFVAEDYAPLQAVTDFAQLGNQNTSMRFQLLDTLRDNANAFMELSFKETAGNIMGAGNSGPIELRIFKSDYSLFNESNDYSFTPDVDYTLARKITVYEDGKLIWGDEPVQLPVEPIALKVIYKNLDKKAADAEIKPAIKIVNEGSVKIDYKDLTVRYWFSKDGNAALNSYIDYAEKLSGKVNLSLTPTGASKKSTDTYLEFKFVNSSGLLYGFSNSGVIEARMNKTDWSIFNEANDYSYSTASVYSANDHITLYYKGMLIYGTEPADSVTSAFFVSSSKTPAIANEKERVFQVYPNPATTSVSLELNKAFASVSTVNVYDMAGKKMNVSVKRSPSMLQVNTSQLTPGLYLLSVKEGRAIHQYKFVISK